MGVLEFWPFLPRRLVPPGRTFTVMVADQDVKVRAVLEEFLGRRGCHSFFARDGTGALRCLAMSQDQTRAIGRIDAVIADADLPGRSGIDLLMAARGNRWDVPMVLTVVDACEALRTELLRIGAAAVLGKPLSLPLVERALSGLVPHGGGR
jgi:CheY-like chemotaxis protein